MGKRVNHDWEPEVGDDLFGTVTDAFVVKGTRYGDIDVAVITDAETDSKVGVWLSRTMLKNLFEEERPQLGSLVHIAYLGPATSKRSGYTYHSYMMAAGEPMDVTGRDWIEDLVDDLRKAKHR